ncbi:MAG: transcription factor S [Candidatus Aenigmatarchaeota archaeon]
MEFCNCGGLMLPKKSGSKVVLVCRKCGKKTTPKEKKFKITVSSEKIKSKIIVLDKKSKIDVLPKTDAACPKCDNKIAFWWMQQMRAADEAPTRFYRCVKCNHVWREYE